MNKSNMNLISSFGRQAAKQTNLTAADPEGRTEMINVDLIDENPDNEVYSMDGIDRLAESIEKNGFDGGIIVTKKDGGRYEVISGHRRLRAVKQLGMKKIRCFVKEYSGKRKEEEKIEALLLANINNREISTIEKSRAVKLYFDKVLDVEYPEESQAEKVERAGKFFGMKSANINMLLGFQNLNPKLQEYIGMPGFPVHGFVGTKRMSEKQVDTLIERIESTDGFAEYREGNENCPLTSRSLKALVNDVLGKNKKKKKDGEERTEEQQEGENYNKNVNDNNEITLSGIIADENGEERGNSAKAGNGVAGSGNISDKNIGDKGKNTDAGDIQDTDAGNVTDFENVANVSKDITTNADKNAGFNADGKIDGNSNGSTETLSNLEKIMTSTVTQLSAITAKFTDAGDKKKAKEMYLKLAEKFKKLADEI